MPPGGDTERELRQVAESLVLADRMFRKGKIAESEPMYERSLAMLIRTYAEAHPDVDACLLRLGDIYFAREKFAQSLSTYSRLHGLRCRTLNNHHIDTLSISFKIAKCQERLERLDEAAKTYQEAIAFGEQWVQPGHPLVGSMMESYAILLRKGLNDPQRAAEVEQRAKEFRKRYTGSKGLASRIPARPSSQSLPFAPADSSVSLSPLQSLMLPAASPERTEAPPTRLADPPTRSEEPTTRSEVPPTRTEDPPTKFVESPAPVRVSPLTNEEWPAPMDEQPVKIRKPTPAIKKARAPVNETPEMIEETPSKIPAQDESGVESDYDDDDDYDEDDYELEDQPAPKNFLMIAFIVLVALIVPTFIGWIVISQHPKFAVSQPVRQPASLGATTMPVSGSDMTSHESVAPPTERRAQPLLDAPVDSR